MAKSVTLTKQGLQNIEEELEYLKTKKRKEVSEKIKVALGFGDLSENSEYDEAKNEQAQVEARIVQLENMLKNAVVIAEEDIDVTTIGLGTKAKVYDFEYEEEVEYNIVGSTEANPAEFKISDESPVGRGLLGAHVGDLVDIETPDGTIRFKVLEINK